MSGKDSLLLNEGAPAGAERKVTGALLMHAALGSIQAAQYGWAAGVMNQPQTVVSADLGIDANGAAWSVGVVASFCIAGFAGSSVAGQLADKWGRMRLIQLLNVLFVLGGAACFGAWAIKGSAGYALLVIARALVGVGAGAGSVVTPMYLGEIAPAHAKGALGAVNQFQIVMLILIAEGVGVGMSTSGLWGYMLAIQGALGVFGALTTAWLAESPRWLVAHGKRDAARKALVRLRGYDEADADDEIAEVEEESGSAADLEDGGAAGAKASLTLSQLLADPQLRAALLVAVVLQLSQQFSGINAVFYYSNKFFADAGINGTLGTVLAGAVNVVATAISIPLIERAGRKPLILLAMGGMLTSAVGLTVALLVKSAHADLASTLGPIAIVMVLLFVSFFEFGLGAIPWSIGGELFPEDGRATAMGVAAAANWTANTAVGIAFPFIQSALGNFSFVPFAVWLGGAFVFTLWKVPETKGRTPQELLRQLSGGYSRTG